MNKTQAERMLAAIKELLTGKDLIFVGTSFPMYPPEVTQNVIFRSAHIISTDDDRHYISLSYKQQGLGGGWVASAVPEWTIDEVNRAIHSYTAGITEIPCHASWHIAFKDYGQWEREYNAFHAARQTATQAGEGA